MHRLLAPLAACALLSACVVSPEPPPEVVPETIPHWPPVPQWSSTPEPDEPEPTEPAEPADNVFYRAPRVKKTSCRLPQVRTGDWTSMKKYLGGVSSCLDRIWSREFDQVSLPFREARRKFVRKRERTGTCGLMPAKEAAGTYCDTGIYYVIVEKPGLNSWNAPYSAEVVAHEYGHHVQGFASIDEYRDAALGKAKNKKAEDLVSRRFELQAECLAGVALNAMRGEMPSIAWFRDGYQGTLPKQWVRDHGRLTTQWKWLEKGYRAGRPGACDTWSVPARQVT